MCDHRGERESERPKEKKTGRHRRSSTHNMDMRRYQTRDVFTQCETPIRTQFKWVTRSILRTHTHTLSLQFIYNTCKINAALNGRDARRCDDGRARCMREYYEKWSVRIGRCAALVLEHAWSDREVEPSVAAHWTHKTADSPEQIVQLNLIT